MKRALTMIVSAALAACVALLAAGCSGLPSTEEALSASAASPTVAPTSTMVEGVLTVGINADDAPYAWRSMSTSASAAPIEGVDVDVALAMAERMGLTVAFVNVGGNAYAASNGACDVVMGCTSATVSDGREVIVGSYAESAPSVFAKSPVAVPTVADLAVASVGVQENSASARALQAMAPTVALVGYATLNDAFAALEAGSVAYVACDSFMGGYLATAYPDIELAGALGSPEARGVAVPSANADLQAGVRGALDLMSADGELRSIRADWVGDLAAITTANQIAAADPGQPA